MYRKINYLIVLIIIVVTGITIYEYKIASLNLKVTEIWIDDIKFDWDNCSRMYGIDENYKLENINNFKQVCVRYECTSKYLFKNFGDCQLVFDNDADQLSDIIVGSNPDGGEEPIFIKSRKTNSEFTGILINPKEYTDEEIMNKLKNIKIKLVCKKNGKVIAESNSVQLQVNS